ALQVLFDYVPVMIDIFEPGGRMVWANREWERALGYTLDEVADNPMSFFYPDEEVRKHVEETITQAAAAWHEFEVTTRDGTKLQTQWCNLRLSDGTIIGIGQDITARKQAEALRTRFIEDVIVAQEDERRRLALELHDEMGQSLTSLLVGLKTLEESLKDPTKREKMRQLRELTAQSVREVGRLAQGLRPTALDDLGFPEAIEAHVGEIQRGHSLKVDLHMNGFNARERMPTQVENHLYRMVQEALTNVIKHAKASSVSVVLRRSDEHVLAIVEDDGTGLGPTPGGGPRDVDPTTPRYDQLRDPGPHDALRLASIRERAQLLQGSVSVESVAGHGTTLYIKVPLSVGG
ncbi:MAG: PAS domain-containing sensor histidine kinase, partial [Clostridia bacterium]|nr:PAS domain-containing sensor histidine kinase [Deltaproteobacteria bacterium]